MIVLLALSFLTPSLETETVFSLPLLSRVVFSTVTTSSYVSTARVIIFSASLAADLALSIVVSMLPYHKRSVARFETNASFWSVGFPNFVFIPFLLNLHLS